MLVVVLAGSGVGHAHGVVAHLGDQHPRAPEGPGEATSGPRLSWWVGVGSDTWPSSLVLVLVQLCDLYETDSIFDKFSCAVSGDGRHVATGSYNNVFQVGRPQSLGSAS